MLRKLFFCLLVTKLVSAESDQIPHSSTSPETIGPYSQTDDVPESSSPNSAVTLARKSSLHEKLASPNCVDLAFIRTNGLQACNRNSMALEITEVGIAIANCYLRNQIKHLKKDEILCSPGESLCLSSLKDYQRRILMGVSSQLGLYCSVHLMRKEKHKFAESLSQCSRTALTIQDMLKQTKQVHEAVLEQENNSLKVLETLATQADLQTQREITLVEQEISKLECEVAGLAEDSLEEELALTGRPVSRLEYVAGKLDFFVYFVLFCMHGLILLLLAALLPNSCDVSFLEIFSSLLLGWFIHAAVGGLQTGSSLFANLIPEVYFQATKVGIFVYFGILKFFALLVRLTPKQQENLLIDQLVVSFNQLRDKLAGGGVVQLHNPQHSHQNGIPQMSPHHQGGNSLSKQSPSKRVFQEISPTRYGDGQTNENSNPNTQNRAVTSRHGTSSKARVGGASNGKGNEVYAQIPSIMLR